MSYSGYYDKHYREYGPISKTHMTFQKFVLALGPEYIQQLMLDRDQGFSSRMGYGGPLGDFFAGRNVLELACGTGYWTVPVAARSHAVARRSTRLSGSLQRRLFIKSSCSRMMRNGGLPCTT